MTQPVQEPSQGRIDQAQDYRSRQLFRRPSSQASTGGSTYRNTSVKYSLGGPEWKSTIIFASVGITRTVDTTVPYGGYMELNGLNKYVVVGMPLGPAGSIWGVDMAFRKDVDGGQVIMEWQTQLVDALQFGATSYPEVVDGPDTSAPWYTNFGQTFDQDFYAAAPSDFFVGQYSVLSPSGAGTAMLTANGTAAPNPPYGALTVREMNGGGDGGVMWYLRLRVSGQNGASSGYKARIYYLAVKRYQGTDGHELF